MDKETINIYFYSTLCSNHTFERLFHEHNVKASIAAQTFYKLLAEGFTLVSGVNVNVVSTLPINSKEQKKVLWKIPPETEGNINYEYISLINIPVLRNILVNLFVFFKIIFKRFPRKATNVILVDFLRLTINSSVRLATKIKGIRVLAIVNDLPGQSVLKNSLVARIRDKFIFKPKYDYYVCVTRQLNEAVNITKKPSILMESLVDTKMGYIDNKLANKYDGRVILYAGGLYEGYGIKLLIEAFELFPEKDLKLWFFGYGPYVNEIINYSKKDNRIQYKGIIPNSEMLEILTRATLLINPRPTHEGFSKYSFPSKNLEYMASGTPLLTTKLPGIPLDHYPYIFLIEEDSIEGIYQGINNVLSMSKLEIHNFGLDAKEYVLREKNNIKQAGKIISLLKSNY